MAKANTILLVLFSIVIILFLYKFDKDRGLNKNTSSASESACNVQGVKIRGDLVNYIPKSDSSEYGNQLNSDETASEDIYQAIKKAEDNPNIKAILIDIDSPGGSGVAAKEIETTLKRSNKPSVAFIREGGQSGAYWLATGANIIFASNISSIGKIGVNASYLDNIQKNIQEGYTYHSITTGDYKDLGDPNKPLTKEDENLLKNQINFVFEDFVKSVATNRKLSEDKVKKLANGSSYYGGEALRLGLIDKLGNMDDVSDYLKTNILGGQKANICW